MKLYFTILLMAGLIISCNSNKGSSKSKGKTKNYNYSAASSNQEKKVETKSSSTSSNQNNLSEQTSIEFIEEEPSDNRRPRTNFQGASGVGTGGSYASSYYRQESMKKKDKKEMYKGRNFDYMYQDENTAHLTPERDSSDISQDSITTIEDIEYEW